MLLTFFLSFFGLMIAFRTVEFLISNQMISHCYREMCLVVVAFGILGLQFLLRHQLMLNWLCLFGIFSFPVVFFQIQETKRKKDFERNIVSFLDSIVIRLRSGHSLKDAVQDLGQMYPGPSRFYFQEIGSLLSFSSAKRICSKDRLFEETLQEFVAVHKATHKSADKIKAFRRKIKTEQDFRRKSRQVTLQVKAQSVILGILFLALLGYSISTYPLNQIKKMVFVSVGLFVLGLVINLQIMRRFRWKV